MAYVLVFLSGVAGLIYEILWMKQLGLLFGNTSHAAATTFAAFFGGLAVGSWLWGKRSAGGGNPLRTYAWLEVGVAATALLYFVILNVFYHIYPAVYQGVDSSALMLFVKFLLALILIFPPAFCMGGTIPVMGQYLIRRQSTFGSTSALLYGVNTLGAALGAFLAGFYLPAWLGFNATCLVAMAITGAVASLAFLWSQRAQIEDRGVFETADEHTEEEIALSSVKAEGRWAVMWVCFLSGFGVLALEVLWTRMFAQVLENSVYTFSAILVVVLLCLAAGAFVSSRLACLTVSPFFLLALLTLLSGLAIMTTPHVFMKLTNSFQILALRDSWSRYVILIFKTAFLTIGPTVLLLGTIFPLVMKSEERYAVSAGRSLGRLAAINTIGAILGSILCGFLLLGNLGMWRTMQLIACLYLIVAIMLPMAGRWKSFALKAAGCVLLTLLFTALDPTTLPVTSVDSMRQIQEILETWEGSDCTVALARDEYGLSIKINSHYGLGSTGAYMQERLQGDIPLMVFPETEDIFFLGMGTGITAGSVLDPQFPSVGSVVVCELVPEVITAARKYMTNVDGVDCTGGLFSDPRVSLLAEDGRHYLMATRDQYSIVNADLFVPYRSGAGSLYSKEHFESVKERLAPGGVFFQWLPLYQVTESEFFVITRTMLEVFDQVSLWRNNFQPGEEVVALVGHTDATPLPACSIDSSADKRTAVAGKTHHDLQRLSLPFNAQTILFFYCGNVTAARELFDGYPVNTDDRPRIEYMAPRTYRNLKDATIPWFVGPRIARVIEEIQRRCPPDTDPLLVNRSVDNRKLPAAGIAFHRARLWEIMGREQDCRIAWQQFLEQWVGERAQ